MDAGERFAKIARDRKFSPSRRRVASYPPIIIASILYFKLKSTRVNNAEILYFRRYLGMSSPECNLYSFIVVQIYSP